MIFFVCVVSKVYNGNTDQNTPVTNDIPSPGKYIEARYIRVLPQEFRANMCMRVEFYECVGKLMVLLLSFSDDFCLVISFPPYSG